MPFKSKKQRRWMYANKPEMAKKWEEHTPDDADLPEEVSESMDPKLRSISDDFDRFCIENNIDYNIQSDMVNEQIYAIRGDNKDLEKFARDLAAEKAVNFNISRDQMATKFAFTTAAVQEDQYKNPTRRHARTQAPFSGSSFGTAPTFGGDTGNTRNKKKKKSTKEKIEEVFSNNMGMLDDGAVVIDITTEFEEPEQNCTDNPIIQKVEELLSMLDCGDTAGMETNELRTVLHRMKGSDDYDASQGNMESEYIPPPEESELNCCIDDVLSSDAFSYCGGIDLHSLLNKDSQI